LKNLTKLLFLIILVLFVSCGKSEAPDFELQSVEGKTIRLSDYRGRIVIIDFWATWCPPCRAGIPDLIKLKEKYAASELEIIGISVDKNKSELPKFIKSFKINYPIVYYNNQVVSDYGGISAIPTTVVVNPEGEIAEQFTGLRPISYYEGIIKKIGVSASIKMQNDKQQLAGIAEEFISDFELEVLKNKKEYCSSVSERFCSLVNDKHLLDMKIISTKISGENENADKYERNIIQKFAVLENDKKLNRKTENYELLEFQGSKYIRYVKPLFIKDGCLKCHGQNQVSEAKAEKFVKTFPGKKITGYKKDEFIGAVSVMKIL